MNRFIRHHIENGIYLVAEAGRMLFAHSRTKKDNPNDSDRVSKFLTRWGLSYHEVKKVTAQA